MKVKILDAEIECIFAHEINEFIKDKKVIDIKYCVQNIPEDEDVYLARSVLIMYEDNENEK